jgi:hypothetical protein
MPTYTFTEEQARTAHDEWGCNCGPTALAFALQTTLEAVRYALPDFPARRYTSPTMMSGALVELGRTFKAVRNPSNGGKLQASIDAMFAGPMSLTRIQWTGPWTANGANAKWAARQTHWIATWAERGVPIIFDCNGGIQGLGAWETNIVPLIVETIPRADGGWYAANVWRIE